MRGIVQEFFAQLWEVTIAPIDHGVTSLVDFRWRKESHDLLDLFVPDIAIPKY